MDEVLDQTKTDKETCDHGVVYNSKEGCTMTPNQVRTKFPRLFGSCPLGCGYHGIAYASFEHYIAGDW